MIQTNFTSKFRMIFINFDTMHDKCIDRQLANNFKCLIVNKSVDNIRLHTIEEIQHAEYVSITAIPSLYNFGACPFHTILLRRPKDLLIVIDLMALSLMAFITCILTGVVGFIGILAVARLKLLTNSNEQTTESNVKPQCD